MSHLAQRAGRALTWKVVQVAGVKGLFLARTLILARLLSPDDFGLLAIGTVAVGMLMSVTELGMTPALVQHPKVEEWHYNAAWSVNVVRALCVTSVLLVAAPAIAVLFAEPRAVAILRLLALRPLIEASSSIKMAEVTRNLRFQRLALVSLMAAVLDTTVSIVLATTLGVWALVAGALSGALAGAVCSYVLAPHWPRVLLTAKTVRPLIRYGRWVFLTGLVAVSASSLTQIVISRRLGAVELGLYFLASKLAFLPYEVASQVVGDVAFSVYARIQEDRIRVAKAFRSHLVGMATFLLPIYMLLIAAAPWLVADLLGVRWQGTDVLIQLLAIAGIAGLFGDTSGPLFQGLGHPNWILAIETLQSSLVIVLLWTLTGHYGVLGAPLSWLIAIASSQVLSFALAKRILRKPFEGSLLSLAFALLASLAGATTVMALNRFLSGATGLLIAVSVAAGVISVVLWFGDRRFNLGLRGDIARAFPQVSTAVGLTPAMR